MSATENGGAEAEDAISSAEATDDNELMDMDDLRDSDEEDSIVGCPDSSSAVTAAADDTAGGAQ